MEEDYYFMSLKSFGKLLICSTYFLLVPTVYAWRDPPAPSFFSDCNASNKTCYPSNYARWISPGDLEHYAILDCWDTNVLEPNGFSPSYQYLESGQFGDPDKYELGVSTLAEDTPYLRKSVDINASNLAGCSYQYAHWDTGNQTWQTSNSDNRIKLAPIEEVFYSPTPWWCWSPSGDQDCDISENYGLGASIEHREFINLGNLSYVEIDQSTATASASLGYGWLDFSGDTSTASAQMSCRIDILQRCSGGDSASFTTESPVAHVVLDDAYTSTEELYGPGSSYFSGYGWGSPESDSTWKADRVRVPYREGMDCEYPTATVCTVGHELIYESPPDANPLTTASQPPGLFSGTSTTPESSNPLVWVWNQIKNWFTAFFYPKLTLTEYEIAQLDAKMQTKAPFAYFYTITTINFDDVATSSAPMIVLPVGGMGGLPFTQNITLPDVIGDFASLFRNAISIVLWFVFVVYLFFLGRRLF